MAININLKDLIKSKGYTIAKLSKEIDITPANLSKLVNNKVSEIKLDTLNKICEVLKCSPGEILEFELKTRKKVIPFFLDYVGGTDDLLAEGVENIKKFFRFIKEFQDINEIEIKIIIMTGLPFESAKNKYRLLDKLAESSGLPELFYGVVIEHCGFFMNKEKTIQLKPIDSRLIEKRPEIEIIANRFNVEISNNYTSIYNIFFNKKITRSELAKISEMLDDVINCNEIEVITYYDKYGCEIDIKDKENSKANAVLILTNSLKTAYDISLVVMGGAPLKNDWDMYKNSKNELNKMRCDVIDIITPGFEEAKEIDHNDKDVIPIDLSKYDNISKLFVEINSRLNRNK